MLREKMIVHLISFFRTLTITQDGNVSEEVMYPKAKKDN